jgi:hypothetical protein
MKKVAVRWLAALVVALVVVVPGMTVFAGPAEQFTVTDGMVVGLQNTPHLFIGDAQGVLHWAGDTRALANVNVVWSNRRDVSLDTLRGMNRGDPFLSSGLVKSGDPIYLSKWETNASAPTLLHIQSIQDVEIFGINTNNYGKFVMSQADWEAKYGFRFANVQKGELAGAVATPTPVATATPTVTLAAKLLDVTRTGDNEFAYRFEITGVKPGTTISVSFSGTEYDCTNTCSTDAGTRSVSWGPLTGIGPANANGRVIYTDRHGFYKEGKYTFTDATGASTTVTTSRPPGWLMRISSNRPVA